MCMYVCTQFQFVWHNRFQLRNEYQKKQKRRKKSILFALESSKCSIEFRHRHVSQTIHSFELWQQQQRPAQCYLFLSILGHTEKKLFLLYFFHFFFRRDFDKIGKRRATITKTTTKSNFMQSKRSNRMMM